MQQNGNNFQKEINFHNLDDADKLDLYKHLNKCKNYALNKSYRNFPNIPIERQDLESIAWIAFEEIVEKFKTYQGPKTFISFFMDNVYWRCNDYCEKFTNNHHRILNLSNSVYYYQDFNYEKSLTIPDIDMQISLKQYYKNLPPTDDRKIVFSLLFLNLTPVEIKKKIYSSKTKVYRTIKLIANDLKDIV